MTLLIRTKRFLCTPILLTAFALSSTGATAQTPPVKTLRLVPHADLKVLDPTFTIAYITRNFGHMVYDTLFAYDAKGVAQPQMVERYSKSADSKTWTFTLRPGLKFSDGNAVTSADCVASLQRWAGRDNTGKAMAAAGGEWKVVDARTFTLTLKEPFGLVLDGLSKVSSYQPVIMPERLARLPTNAPIQEVVGSGPFLFKRDEWVPGNKVVFVRNPAYVGRKEAPSGFAGNKTPKVDRVEWLILPDANSASAALKNGEVDLLEEVPPDNIAPLLTDPAIKIIKRGSNQGYVALNQAQPPFNNPALRQAVMMAVNQERFTAAMGYPANLRIPYCATFFICGSANDTSVGSERYMPRDVNKARQMVKDAGYKGERVVVMVPTDIAYLNGAGMILAQTLKSIGFNVDLQSMDWSSIVARRTKKDGVDQGGWSAYATSAGEFDLNSPINSTNLGAACGNSLPGWPCDEQLDKLRTAWIQQTEPAARRRALEAFHRRAYETLPYIPVGQFSPAYGARATLKHTDLLWSTPNVWVLDK
jgi:peptide/nickel transport system substrate-binding protein